MTDLSSLLLGAAATLATTTFIQLWVVPRVESGKRREDRWERDVITLSEFLAFEYADAQSAVTGAMYERALLADFKPTDHTDPARLQARRAEAQREAREAFDALARAQARAQIMLDRVTYLDRDRVRATKVEMALRIAGFTFDQHSLYDDSPPPTLDEAFEISRQASADLKPVTSYLKECVRNGRAARKITLKRRLRTLRHSALKRVQPRSKPEPAPVADTGG
jgi:hypothetical protein